MVSPTVTSAWLQAHLGDESVTVIDVRVPQLYAQSHLPGAINLPAFLLLALTGGPPDPTALERRLGNAGLIGEEYIIAYDDGASALAAQFYWLLTYFGHRDLSVLDGGITQWMHQQRPISTEPSTREPAQYRRGEGRPAVYAKLEDVMAAMGSPSSILVDTRSPAEYLGVQTTAARDGHIPGAINIDFSQNMQRDAGGVVSLLSENELRTLYETAEVTPDKEVIVYCRSGSRAALTFLALKELGYPNVALYSPGWLEWGNRDDTPVVPDER